MSLEQVVARARDAWAWLIESGASPIFAWASQHPGPVANVAIGIATGLIAVLGFLVAARINLKNKTVDCVMHCNLRYESLYSDKSRLAGAYLNSRDDPAKRESVEEQVRHYYNRFWGLKSDQFDYWLSGFIDPETMCGYFFSVVRSFQADGSDTEPNHPFSNASFRKRWFEGQVHHRATDPIFNDLIATLAALGAKLDRDLAVQRKATGQRRGRDPYTEAYDALIQRFEHIERRDRQTIKFMVNVTPRSIARRARMVSYRRMRRASEQSRRARSYRMTDALAGIPLP